MHRERIYESAREFLREIEDIPTGGEMTVGELLFLTRNCMRTTEGGMDIIASFSEEDLQELMKITKAILSRQRSETIH